MIDLWSAVKDLPIAIESYSFEALLPSGPTGLEDFSTTQLRLQGRGEEGVGEQVGMGDAQESLRASDFPLTGEWATLAGSPLKLSRATRRITTVGARDPQRVSSGVPGIAVRGRVAAVSSGAD